MVFIEYIKKLFLGDDGNSQLSNLSLEEQIIKYFKLGIDLLSLKNRILYPTDFTIHLHSSNFEMLKPSFPFIVDDCIQEFVKILEKKMKGIPTRPHSRNWHFQFAECSSEALIKGTNEKVEKEKPVIILGIVPSADGAGGGMSQQHFVGTKNGPLSKLADRFDINEEGLNVTYLGGNAFERPIKLDFVDSQQVADKNASSTPRPRLMITGKSFTGGQNGVLLSSDIVFVCGKVGLQSKVGQVVCIDDVSVMNPHFRIERIENSNKYSIIPYADIRLNGVEIKKNKSRDLPNNSNIVINNEINLRFNPRS